MLFQNKINSRYCASGWFYYRNILRRTVLQTSNLTKLIVAFRNLANAPPKPREGRNISSFVCLYIWNEFHALFRPMSRLKGLKAEGMCILFVSTFFYYKRIYMVVRSINSQPIPKHVNVYSCGYTQYKRRAYKLKVPVHIIHTIWHDSTNVFLENRSGCSQRAVP
jgi:hypothetical protein